MDWKAQARDSGHGYFTLTTEDTGDVPVRLFLTPALLDSVEDSIYPQIVNAARFPGVRMVAITPDVHHGYGVPIGTVLLTDADTGAVAMGPVGYDIGCFTGHTRVATGDGAARTLRDMAEAGGQHSILAFDPHSGPTRAMAIARRTRRDAPLVRVTLDRKNSVECTPDHQFMLRDGSWRQAQQLGPGTALIGKDSSNRVLSVSRLRRREDVY
jgi:tRNA-splicing ligase RtcB